MKETVEYTSPRIAALRAALAAGQTGAAEAFWEEVEARGTPLLEPDPSDSRMMLVTFVARGDDETQNMVVFRGPAGLNTADGMLERIPQTDIWRRTYRVGRDMRTLYMLGRNDSLVPLAGEPDWAARMASLFPDPLNPRRFVLPRDEDIADDQEMVLSELVLPDAPPQPWVERLPGVPSGNVALYRLKSDLLGVERRIWVYTPPSYTASGEPYDLLVIFDGLAELLVIPTPEILDNLQAKGLIRPAVMLVIDSLDTKTRMRDLMASDQFTQYLTDELLPWLRERYQVTSDPARVTVAGQSAGGVAAAYAALRRPDVFGAALSQSGAFWWRPEEETTPNWFTSLYAAAPRLPIRFYLDAGLLENIPARTDDPDSSILAANRALRAVLQAKGYDLTYREFNGGHDYNVWRGTLADGLLALGAVQGDAPATAARETASADGSAAAT